MKVILSRQLILKMNNDKYYTGYKAFTSDFKDSQGIQFKVGQVYNYEGELNVEKNQGFSFYLNLSDTFTDFPIINTDCHRYCEIMYDRSNTLFEESNSKKGVTREMYVARELTEKQIRKLGKIQVFRNKFRELHREDDLPAVTRYYKDGRKCEECWYNHNQLHRANNKPAKLTWYPLTNNDAMYNESLRVIGDGLEKEEYYIKGQLHSNSSTPSSIHYHPNGQKKKIEYLMNGQLHREGNKPALIEWNDKGKITVKKYYINNQLHCDNCDKPAYIEYYDNSSLKLTEWYIHGELKRICDDDLPCSVEYYNNDGVIGHLKCEKWFIENNKLGRSNPTLPSMIEYSGNSENYKIKETWYNENGEIGNCNPYLPSIIEYVGENNKLCEQYWINNVHRASIYLPGKLLHIIYEKDRSIEDQENEMQEFFAHTIYGDISQPVTQCHIYEKN